MDGSSSCKHTHTHNRGYSDTIQRGFVVFVPHVNICVTPPSVYQLEIFPQTVVFVFTVVLLIQFGRKAATGPITRQTCADACGADVPVMWTVSQTTHI